MSNPPVAPTPPAAVSGAKKGLSLTSFILGIASIVLFALNWIAALIGLVAVVLGFIGRSREPGAPRWMWLLGIIFGFVGIVVGIGVFVAVIAAANYLQQTGQLTK